jgi:hypothetical protein
MTINSNTPAAAPTAPAVADIRDIQPPFAIASAQDWLWWVLLALILAVAAWLLWRRWRHKKAVVPAIPPVPAHIRAKQKLAAALALIGQPKPFCIQVSDTVRYYLEERFEIHAPERTTEEFLRELRGTDLLLSDQKESLGRFLASCDLVKFAKYEPGQAELQGLHDSALRLVEETEPPPVVAGAAPAENRPS